MGISPPRTYLRATTKRRSGGGAPRDLIMYGQRVSIIAQEAVDVRSAEDSKPRTRILWPVYTQRLPSSGTRLRMGILFPTMWLLAPESHGGGCVPRVMSGKRSFMSVQKVLGLRVVATVPTRRCRLPTPSPHASPTLLLSGIR